MAIESIDDAEVNLERSGDHRGVVYGNLRPAEATMCANL